MKNTSAMPAVGIGLLGLAGCYTAGSRGNIEHQRIEAVPLGLHLPGIHDESPQAPTSVASRSHSAERNATLRQLERWGSIRAALDRFHHTVGRYPTTEEDLMALIDRPATFTENERKAWRGPYLIKASALLDPWGRRFRYRHPPVENDPAERPEIQIEGNRLRVEPPNAPRQISWDRKSIVFFPDQLDVWSVGPDGLDGTEDDIGNWHVYQPPRR